eukprot:5060375-Pyramimonas_sp.AAC.1
MGPGHRAHLADPRPEAGLSASAPFLAELPGPSGQASAGAVRRWNGRANACASGSTHGVVDDSTQLSIRPRRRRCDALASKLDGSWIDHALRA